MNIYLLPGHGNDGRLFYKLHFEAINQPIIIEMPGPEDNESIALYAERLCSQVDTSQPFVLLGVSLGGILAIEMAKHIYPHKIIIISSVKTRFELPLQMKVLRKIRAFEDKISHKNLPFTILPSYFLKKLKNSPYWLHNSVRTIFRIAMPRLSHSEAMVFMDMMADANLRFMNWAEIEIINWQNVQTFENLVHIHGSKDNVFPPKNILNYKPIKGGDHTMIVQKATQVNSVINSILNDAG